MVSIMAQIDRKSKTPVYKQIYEDINFRIQKGEYALGSMLPSESKLCSIYGVERATVRRALALMVNDGKIAKIPGLGASVIMPEENNEPKKKCVLFLLPKGRHNTDRISEPFNVKLMATMEYECFERGYDLLYKSFNKNDTAEDLIRSYNPCGVFFTSCLPIETYKILRLKGIPVVLVNQNNPSCPFVCVDNRGGTKMVMEYLVDLGHKHIGIICGPAKDQIQMSRFNGYRESLENNALELNTDWIMQGDWSMESGKAAMQKLLKKGNLPTALFAANDAMAIGAILEATNSGVSIPESISIVGFDNIDQSSFVTPSLTTVAVDYHAMSKAACMLMFDMIGHNSCELNVNIYVPLNLVERESTKRLAV